MAICKKCNSEVKWSKSASDKWIPVNPDGSAHWDKCKELTRGNWTPEQRKAADDRNPPITVRGNSTHVWSESQDRTPWHEQLGPFRHFTEEEMAVGAVCVAAG